ncbi:SDR family NAD(P)-dependent oxidoreductase [Frankia sp. ArI3]|uniref:SDR family NAD(P)-dependent oxidoreductase n=1 Tax=Frankia sp. ArI3 TaxID=1858 RepID=UPI002107B74F|nr:SDR family NAD(P)-dependent oxidoreductase [Frankia sp. ArI3]
MRIEQGQVAVVTGAASGIGYGLAEALAARGVAVVLSDVQTDAVERAAATLAATGATTLAVAADVGDADQVGALAAATIDRFGRVDLVCNNAGVVSRPAPMWEQSLASWRWLIDVALLGVVHGVHHFVPHLIRQGGGHVLNTASVGGLMPLPTLTPYNAVKHAVIGLTETLNLELRGGRSHPRRERAVPGAGGDGARRDVAGEPAGGGGDARPDGHPRRPGGAARRRRPAAGGRRPDRARGRRGRPGPHPHQPGDGRGGAGARRGAARRPPLVGPRSRGRDRAWTTPGVVLRRAGAAPGRPAARG